MVFARRPQPPMHSTGHPGFLFPTRQAPPTPGGIQGLIQNFSNTGSLTSMANKGINGLSKTLGNVQQIIRVVHSAAPVIQQYGPMVKNLPAMYRMMKAMKDINDDDQDIEAKPEANEPKKEQPVKDIKQEKSNSDPSPPEQPESQTFHNDYGGNAPPRLFI